jgi:hypothetical protein
LNLARGGLFFPAEPEFCGRFLTWANSYLVPSALAMAARSMSATSVSPPKFASAALHAASSSGAAAMRRASSKRSRCRQICVPSAEITKASGTFVAPHLLSVLRHGPGVCGIGVSNLNRAAATATTSHGSRQSEGRPANPGAAARKRKDRRGGLEFCHQRQVTRSPVSSVRGADDEGILSRP